MHSRYIRHLARQAPMVLLASALGCPSKECWCVPEVRTVSVVPAVIDVEAGSEFELRVRLFDKDDKEIPEFFAFTPHWGITTGSGANVVRRSGHRVVLNAPTTVMLSSFQVTADIAGASAASAQVNVHKTAPTNDHVVGTPLADGEPLSIALGTAPTNPDPSPIAFSGYANLGDLRGGAGSVMVLSHNHAMAYADVNWTDPLGEYFRHQATADVNALATQQDPKPVLRKDVTFWILAGAEDQWPATSAVAMTELLLADANQTFRRNRVGLVFQAREIFRIIGYLPPSDCGDWGAKVRGESFTSTASEDYDPSPTAPTAVAYAIDVFVVPMTIDTGWSCSQAIGPDERYRVFLNANHTQPDVLGHELGHTFLSVTDQDHLDAAPMGKSNLMTEGEDHEGALPRRHISVGQACLMNKMRETAGKLRDAAGLPRVTNCPSVTKDIP